MTTRSRLQEISEEQDNLKRQLTACIDRLLPLESELGKKWKIFNFLKLKKSKAARSTLATLAKEIDEIKSQRKVEKKTEKDIMLKRQKLSIEFNKLKRNEENLYIQEQCTEMVQAFLEELRNHLTDLAILCVRSKTNRTYGISFELSEFWAVREFPLYWASGRTTWYTRKYPSGCFTVSNEMAEISVSSKDFYFNEYLQVEWHQFDEDGRDEDLAYTWFCVYNKNWYEEFKKKFYECFLNTLTDKYDCSDDFILKVTSASTFTLELV